MSGTLHLHYVLCLLSLGGIDIEPQPALYRHGLTLTLLLIHLFVEVVHDLRNLITALACCVSGTENPDRAFPFGCNVLIPRLADAHKACGIVHHVVQEVLLHLVTMA